MNATRDYDIAYFTAIAAAVFGIGLILFAADMRTVQAPADHQLIADAGAILLMATAVISGLLAFVIRRQAIRTGR